MSDKKIVLTKEELEATIRKMAREHLNEQAGIDDTLNVMKIVFDVMNKAKRAAVQAIYDNLQQVKPDITVADAKRNAQNIVYELFGGDTSPLYRMLASRISELAYDQSMSEMNAPAPSLDTRVAEAFDKAIESVDPSDTDALIEAMTNEIFGFGGGYGGKDRERIEPNVDRKFGDMKEKLGVAVKQFMRDRANPAKRKMASQVIHGMIGKRGNPSQILKSMTDLGLKADEVWAEILGDVGAGM